jgi:hypothetical protein
VPEFPSREWLDEWARAERSALWAFTRTSRSTAAGVLVEPEPSPDVRGVCVRCRRGGAGPEAVQNGTVDPLPMISHTLALDDAPLGYELFASRQATKVVLRP